MPDSSKALWQRIGLRCALLAAMIPLVLYGLPAVWYLLGPFILAASREVPLLCTFVMKESLKTYHVYVRELKFDASLQDKGPRVRAAALAQALADCLTEIVRKYPHQWFNYYDFWNEECT